MARERSKERELDQTADKLVWIIEDDKLLSEILKKSLTNQGFHCVCFLSGKQALDYIDNLNGQEESAIMLLDYLLGDMTAMEFLESAHQRKIANPFVIMTGCGDEKIAVQMMKSGAMDYIVKEKMFIGQVVKVIKQVDEKLEINRKLAESRAALRKSAEKLKKLNQKISQQNKTIEAEKARTESLLLNIIPGKVAKELMESGTTIPKHYDQVSIIFADVVGFSDMARKTPPIELVKRLDQYFYIIDEIVEALGIEKIKTIGDCYMCAAGIPEEHPMNAVLAVLAALKIQHTVINMYQNRRPGAPAFRLRLGIHTGEVVAGVVGKNKFAYDIWGDDVNTASRIVDSGEKDKINISENTYQLIQEYFICQERGKIMTKKNISLKMYFVKKLKAQYASDPEGTIPNERLLKILSSPK